MKLHASAQEAYQTVTGYDDNSIAVNAIRYQHSVVLMPEQAPTAWPVTSFDQLQAEHFTPILAHNPELLILGTGTRQHFVHPGLSSVLLERRIGLESMDNQAACRTYNILMAEGRKVALAVILPGAPRA